MVMQQQFSVHGMTCGNCAKHVEKALQALPGVSQSTVDLGKHQVTIQYDSALASQETFASALKEAGYILGSLVS